MAREIRAKLIMELREQGLSRRKIWRGRDALRGELAAECESALPGWKVEVRVIPDI